MTDSVVIILQTMSFLWNIFIFFMKQTEFFTVRESKSPGILKSKSITIFFLNFSIFDPIFKRNF